MSDYKTMHTALKTMTERELRVAIQQEVDRGQSARVDLLSRMVGRYNRVRGSRLQREIIGLLTKKGERKVNAILDSDR